jgi:hypothetical protein
MAACAIENVSPHHYHLGITMDVANAGLADHQVHYDCLPTRLPSSICVADYYCACTACRSAMISFFEMYVAEVPITRCAPYERIGVAERLLASFSRELTNAECNAIVGEVDAWRVWRLVNRCTFCAQMLKKWNAIAASRLIPQLGSAIGDMHIKA